MYDAHHKIVWRYASDYMIDELSSANLIHYAVGHNRVNVVAHYYSPGKIWDHYIMNACVSNASDTFSWLYRMTGGAGFTEYHHVPEGAESMLRTMIITHLIASPASMTIIAQDGKLKNLIYLAANGGSLAANVSCAAAKYGHLHIIKYLHSINHHFGTGVMERASQSGNLELMEYLKSIGVPVTYKCLDRAVKWGKFDSVKLLWKWGCRPTPNTAALAAQSSQWHILEFLINNDVPMDDRVPYYIRNSKYNVEYSTRLLMNITEKYPILRQASIDAPSDPDEYREFINEMNNDDDDDDDN